MKTIKAISLVVLVVVVAGAIVLTAALGLQPGQPNFPTEVISADAFMASTSGSRVDIFFDEDTGCIGATAEGETLTTCEAMQEGQVGDTALRLGIAPREDFDDTDCERHRSYRLSNGFVGNWCFLF